MTPMRSRRRLLPLLALLAGCNLDAPKQYLVPDLRVLAIRDRVTGTRYADADLGEQVTIDALVANPRGRPVVTVDWYACVPSLAAALPPCLDPDWLQRPGDFATAPGVIPLGSGPSVSVSLAPLQAALQTTVDAVLAAAVAEPSLQCRLYAEVPVVAIARADEVTEVAVKRVRVTPTAEIAASFPSLTGAYVVNLNPAVGVVRLAPTDADACADGASLATPCAGPADCGGDACAADGYCEVTLTATSQTLCARGDVAWLQVFNQCQPDGSRVQVTEELEWQWYVSAGTIDQAGFDGNATGQSIDLTPPTGPFTLWVIVRDGRGGTDWLVRSLDGP